MNKKCLFICPVCGEGLDREERCYRCPKGHGFDISKYNYINLLPPGKGVHGDNREMILARRDFLSTGIYGPLKESLVRAAEKYYTDGAYLDAGCGEGYYTEGISRAAGGQVYGIDISKDALRYCAKSIKNGHFAVASAYSLPFGDESLGLVTSVFSPLADKEFHRVLKKDGILILAIPGQDHLFGLKSLLYKTPYKNTVMPYNIGGFDFLEAIDVNYEVTLDREETEKLFKMTPYYYRTPKEGKEKLVSCQSVSTAISFEVLCYKKQ